jgi:hypothetical protein
VNRVSASIDQARHAKSLLTERLAGESLVNGIGLRRASDGWAVQVNLTRTPPAGHELPDSVEGVDVFYDTIGSITSR